MPSFGVWSNGCIVILTLNASWSLLKQRGMPEWLPEALTFLLWGSQSRWFGLACPAPCTRRAWEAGLWARATLQGLVPKPRPSPKLPGFKNTVFVLPLCLPLLGWIPLLSSSGSSHLLLVQTRCPTPFPLSRRRVSTAQGLELPFLNHDDAVTRGENFGQWVELSHGLWRMGRRRRPL